MPAIQITITLDFVSDESLTEAEAKLRSAVRRYFAEKKLIDALNGEQIASIRRDIVVRHFERNQTAHLGRRGNACPYCGHGDLETRAELGYGRGTGANLEATEHFKCLSCRREWEDVFVLAGYRGV